MKRRADAFPAHAVAVVGMAGRFPGARDVEELWENLRAGRESIARFTASELREAGVPEELVADPAYVPVRGLVEGPDRFDAAFFGFSPREAELLDPQHRVLLECAWHALEHAGHDPRRFGGPIGVFAGCGSNTYLLEVLRAGGSLDEAELYQAMLGGDADFLATRISYELGLRGPSFTVQTACSTSLVAAHLAIQSLLSGECDLALAGGARISSPQRAGHRYRPDGIFSPDGHCRPFDADAKGCVEGDGVGIVVLRRLADAVAAGDRVHAVVLGSAANNDGDDKVGYTAPSVSGQAEVIALAQALADVEPASVAYVEAHGTATPLGDPIEVAALGKAFAGVAAGSCALGSIKSNFGHLDAAAGVVSLIKAVLAVERGELPPTLHFRRPNPRLELEGTPFYVNDRLAPWSSADAPRRAGVSSFGIGGTNVHLVLEEPPEAPAAEPAFRSREVLVLSAASEAALEGVTRRLKNHLEARPDLELADVAFTLATGRVPLKHRRIAVCRDTRDAVEVLAGLDPRRVLSRVQEAGSRPVAFLLPGQGTQYPGMAEGLYREEPVFREHLDRCAGGLEPHLGLDLRAVLYPPVEGREEAAGRLRLTALAQPALFAVEYALARLWAAWGVEPAALVGHSLGEIVAACLAGVLRLEDALRLVAARGRLMQSCPTGAMATVGLSEDEVREYLAAGGTAGDLELAAVNAPSLSVVSGPAEAVADLLREMGRRGVEARELHTSHAFHSRLMEPAVSALRSEIQGVDLQAPTVPVISNVSGRWLRPDEAVDPGYWAGQLRATVRFCQGVQELLARGDLVLLEVGPGRTLSSLVRQHRDPVPGRAVFTCLPGPTSGEPDAETLGRSLGQLWLAGVEVDWAAHHAPARRRRLPLPAYPFDGRRFWLEPGADARARRSARAAGRLPRERWLYVPSWRQVPPPRRPAELPERWLIFTRGDDPAAELARELASRGLSPVTVRPGEALEGDEAGGFTLAPDDAAGYEALLERLSAPPERVVHGWALGSPDDPASVRRRGLESLMGLGRALSRAHREEPIHVTVLTDGVHRLTDEETAPAKAVLLGPVLVLPQEVARVSCRSLDLPPRGARAGRRRLVDDLLREAAAPDGETVVAFRGGRRWVPGLEPAPAAESPDPPPLRPGGTYLITGGLGGLGLLVAEHLAETASARLALVGRSGLPLRERWREIAASAPPGDRTAARVRRVLGIEERGGRVLALAADVGDREAMAEVLARVRAELGPVHGLIHAAGVPGSGPIEVATDGRSAEVLRPKVEGTLVLEQLLDFGALDFVVLFSSLNAHFGGPGQADYAGANAFLEAFADSRAGAGKPVVAVAWDRWRGVGMAAGPAAAAEEGAGPTEPFDHPILDRRGALAGGGADFFGRLEPGRAWILDEHRLGGNPVVPGTTYLDLMVTVGRELAGRDGALELRDLVFLAPLRIDDGEARELRVRLFADGDGWAAEVASRPAGGSAPGGWREHAAGRLASVEAAAGSADLEELATRCGGRAEVKGDDYRQELELMGLGARWDSLRTAWVGDGKALGILELPAAFAGDLGDHFLHPALLDVATSFAERHAGAGAEGAYYLPLSYGRVTVQRPLPGRLFTYAEASPDAAAHGETLSFDLRIFDPDGDEVLAIERFTLKRVGDVAQAIRHSAAPRPPEPGSGAPGEADEGLDPADGLQILRRILADGGSPRWAVSTRDPEGALAELRELVAGRGEAGGGARHARPDLDTEYAPPSSELERSLAGLWGEVLGIGGVGIHDDFFELGGHSLLATQVVARIRDRLGLELSIDRLFETPTVAGLAAALEGAGAAAPAEAIPRADRDRELRLSFGQERLWFLDQLDPGSPYYNISHAVQLSGRLEPAALASALELVVARQESLRTTFGSRRGRPFQRVHARVPVALPVVDVGGLPEPHRRQEAERLAAEAAATSFDLAAGPLFALRLVRVDEESHVLAIALHHIVSDGWSVVILVSEVAETYRALRAGERQRLAELPVQYVDFAEWQRRTLEDPGAVEADLAYWRRRLAEPLPVLDLPTDRPRPEVQSFRGRSETVRLPAALTRDFQRLCRARGATVFMGLLSAFAAVLASHSGQDDLLVGSPVAGRDRTELEALIGMFLNMLVLRLDLSGEPTFAEALSRTRETTTGAYAHQRLPVEKVLEAIQPERSGSRPTLFQVQFNMQDFPNREFELPGLTLAGLHLREVPSKFDLTAYAAEVDGEILFELVYNADLFERDRIVGLLEELVAVTEGAVAAPESPLGELVPSWRRRAEASPSAAPAASPEPRLERLKRARRRGVRGGGGDLVEIAPLEPGRPLPLVVRPRIEEVDLAAWIDGHAEVVEERLAHAGALLFRGFSPGSPEAVEAAAPRAVREVALFPDGGEPRQAGPAATRPAAPAPADGEGALRNELSYAHRWPTRLALHCAQPGEPAAAIDLALGREVLERLPDELVRRFVERGVRYVRRLGGNGREGSWQALFGTGDRSAVAAYCAGAGIELEWRPDGSLDTRQNRRAVVPHPGTGASVWFNQVHLWEPALFADGAPIDAADVAAIRRTFAAVRVGLPWQAGDLLLIDNTAVAHGHVASSRPARLTLAMGAVVEVEDLAADGKDLHALER